MTEWLLVAGVWAIAIEIGYAFWLNRPSAKGPDDPTAAAVVTTPRRTRIVMDEAAWSPEGWGKPDSEVVSTDGDDYLQRMHRPPPWETA